jgi:ribonucleoside-triphosphate reductase
MVQNKINKIRKRDGQIVDFNQTKITNAIFKAITATGQGDGQRAKKLSDRVVQILNRRFKKGEIPHVEQIQDIIEEVLILENLVETAKAYILYREQRRRIREAVKVSEEAVDRMDQYLEKLDWEVQENANMAFSLQGLNHYGVSYIVKRYWLNKIYPKEIREANESGDFHLHNLDTLGPYCAGWDLYDLLLKGFGGVPGKVETKPAKHFRAVLGQIVNFLYTLQGETAGAVAFSNFDTLLAPFIRYDNLNYQQVKQALQEFLFNMAVPTRVGFQCVSEDTEILTPEGWKGYDEVKKGDVIKTFNLKNRKIENKKVDYVFRKKYKGIMYRLRNRIQDQLISPQHRVLRKKFNTQNYVLEPIEEVLKLKSPLVVPVAGKNSNPEAKISDEQIKLMAWIISEGSIEKPGRHRCCHRVSIYQSKIKNRKNYDEIVSLLKNFNLAYTNHPATSLGEEVQQIRLNAESSREIHQWFGTKENVHFIPDQLLNLSQRQSRLFLETYLKGDGKEGCKIATSDLGLLNDLEAIIVNAGYGFTVRKQKAANVGKKDIYILRIIRHPETYISKIEKVNYEGVIWCPHTENGTIIARRKGKVFITGNCPFSNITLDLKPSPVFAKQPVIIGGKLQKETYGEFEEEMKIFDRALYETMLEGDKSGRPFHFPIPTINITKDFPWDDPAFDLIFEASAKYGTNYFANYINSEMKPEDVRSMCCRLRLEMTELYNRGGGGLFGSGSKTGCYDEKTEVLTEDGWKLFKDLTERDKVFTLADNNKIELHKPNRFFEYDYRGEMVHFKGRAFDLLVTPNHRMVVDHKHKNKRIFVEAKDFKPYQHFIPKGGIWQGEEKEYFILPAVEALKGTGPVSRFSENDLEIIRRLRKEGTAYYKIAEDFNCSTATVLNVCNNLKYGEHKLWSYQAEPVKIKMDDWLKFFGFWLAEGCTDNNEIASGHGYRVTITQTNKENREEIKKVLDALPFNYYEEKNNIIICSKQLWAYLRQFGNKYQKFIPKEIKKLSKRQLKILFDWLVKGDGHIRKTTGQINYWTASKRLADDLQEIILKLGWIGVLTPQKKKISQIKGRDVVARTIYLIEVHQKTKHFVFNKKRVIKRIDYEGKIYCCEVPNHTVFVRRNGKVSWCGNSIGVVTINLPRIGYLSKTKKDFFERLSKMMDLSKESLEIKRKTIENFIEKSLYPYSKFYLQDIKKARGGYYANHFATIGLVGMNESLLNFIGENIASKRGRNFALEILDFMRKRLVKYQKETGNIYNLEATPAESTSYRLALKDKEKYPDIITAGTKKVPYYTNSSQLPVNYTTDIFEALKLQDELQCKYSGGTVLHLFLGERISDIQTVKTLIKKIFTNFHLPYITLTPTFSICPHHGYISGEHFYCPQCTIKQPCEVYSRIVGYLRPVREWNVGKKEEFKERKEFKIPKTVAVK